MVGDALDRNYPVLTVTSSGLSGTLRQHRTYKMPQMLGKSTFFWGVAECNRMTLKGFQVGAGDDLWQC
jgi:hypothetical protein